MSKSYFLGKTHSEVYAKFRPSLLLPVLDKGSTYFSITSKMSKSYFLGKSHSAAYAKFRTTPPQQLLDKILQYVKEKIPLPLTSALDVGCGSGQSTLILCPYFKHVLGTDVSDNQLALAKKAAEEISNVTFSNSVAEQISCDDRSLQLITASQCLHWLNTDKFYSEVKRVLAPNGVLAVYAYMLPVIKTGDQTVDRLFYDHLMKLHQGTFGSYWDPSRKMVDEGYSSVHLPFSDVQRIEGIWSCSPMTVADYGGYITTWSPYQAYTKKNGQEAAEKLVSEFIIRMLEILQSSKSAEETAVEVCYEYVLLLGRNPEN